MRWDEGCDGMGDGMRGFRRRDEFKWTQAGWDESGHFTFDEMYILFIYILFIYRDDKQLIL